MAKTMTRKAAANSCAHCLRPYRPEFETGWRALEPGNLCCPSCWTNPAIVAKPDTASARDALNDLFAREGYGG